ncbi:uncharacterized protein LOC135383465 [Ornithodoros turicata]|uniref:uncharacterized protein LOC135383465 n=1 Tax=Ornithodoros turicata TaxID=34597 RepID=UPI003139FDB3
MFPSGCIRLAVTLATMSTFANCASADVTPLRKLYENIKREPVTAKQCFRNGTSLEPEDALHVVLTLDGTAYPGDELVSDNTLCYAQPLDSQQQKCVKLPAKYDSESDSASLVTKKGVLTLFLQQAPFNGKAYLIQNYESATNNATYKIYDTDFSCVNAEQLLETLAGRYKNMVRVD